MNENTASAGALPAPAAGDANDTRRRIGAIFGGSIGNLVEWYDWYVYATFALYFSRAFFPASDPVVSQLNTAAVFAAGFLIRPIGSWALGRYADRYGRKSALQFSILLMCTGSLIIAVTPTYSTIGGAAAVLLVVARLLQGFSLGGEYGTSATYLAEVATPGRRGFYSSFQYVTLIAGQLVAICVLLLLQVVLGKAALQDWGWRIPFAVGGVLAIVVFYIRRGLAETASFRNAQAEGAPRSSFVTLVTRHPRETLTVMLLTAGGTLAFYAYSTYMQKFLVNSAGFSIETASRINAVTLFVYMLLQPLAGALSDRIGRKPLMIGFGIGGMLVTYPIFTTLATTRDPVVAGVLVMTALVVVTGYTSINAVVKAELFPAHIRALGVALPYALANTLFGGTAEYVALWFKQAGVESGFYWYVTALIGVSLVVYLRMRETQRESLIAED